jgi:energy-coupling factor transport system ATP-binding protein
VLRDVNLTIRSGEFVALLGPNGAGKSTLLKALAGLNQPGAGSIKLWNRRDELVPARSLSDHVSFVFQDPNHQLFENTVWEEVAFSLRIREEKETVISERVSSVLEKVRLLHLRDRHPATLSRGEKRRLAVATALGFPIELMLLDEPTTGQDLQTLEGLFTILQELNREDDTAILFVTHDMWTVWRYTTRVIGMQDGSVVFDGPTEELLSPEKATLLRDLELSLPLEAALYHRARNTADGESIQQPANHYE